MTASPVTVLLVSSAWGHREHLEAVGRQQLLGALEQLPQLRLDALTEVGLQQLLRARTVPHHASTRCRSSVAPGCDALHTSV
jgi:hypothetical protein